MQRLSHVGTVEEYLALEPVEGVRFEWVGGQVLAMSGGTALHAAVGANALVALQVRLRGRDCRATRSDQRLFVEETGAYFYADVAVICGAYRYAPHDATAVVNPTAVVEVLSPSTRDYDQGAKFAHYRRVPTLQDFLLIDPAARSVMLYRRVAEGWLLEEHTAGDVRLGSLDLTLPLAELFADLDALGPATA